jgi:precorrin-6A/cobalt-precorrin-6A reductase
MPPATHHQHRPIEPSSRRVVEPSHAIFANPNDAKPWHSRFCRQHIASLRESRLRLRTLLILGGTAEASALAHALAPLQNLRPTLSLAGRTSTPRLPPIAHRIGGFGGTAGLVRYLQETNTDGLIDATHPFAARISAHAAAAAATTAIPFVALRRPPWAAQSGDRWTVVASVQDAVLALGASPKRVFLAIGRQELGAFRDLPHHFVIRSVEPPNTTDLPQNATVITARGPFKENDEYALFLQYNISCVVTKNAGGVTGAKLAAARALSLPVIMIARPEKPPAPTVPDVAGVLDWIQSTNRLV